MKDAILHYAQPNAFKRHYGITRDDILIATLEYEGLIGNKATAQAGKHQWTLAKEGWWHPKVLIASNDAQVAVYQQPLFKRTGSVTLKGNTYYFGYKGIGFKSYYAWRDKNGTELITYANGGLIRRRGDITLCTELEDKPTQQLLILLGLFVSFET